MLRPNEMTPFGLTPMELFTRMQTKAEFPVSWLPADDVAYGPERGTTSISVTLEAPTGQAVLKRYAALSGNDAECKPTLEVPLNLRLTTSGGALDERAAALFVARDGERLATRHSIRVADLGGALKASETTGDRALKTVRVAMEITPSGQAGELAVLLDSAPSSDDDESTREVVLARWGEALARKSSSPPTLSR